ncbi:MAG TPA: flotillin domain-containing protein [Kiloniellaceae bacterium]|nr:flotillin domain-containing protein [Kiloniellaceae bacterium]
MAVTTLTETLVIAAILLVALVTIGLIFSRLYRRSTKEISFVRTGLGGQKVIMDGGCLVFPVLHDTIPVNMNTLRLEVLRANEQALITRDRMRVDVQAEFYVRVQPTTESIASAAQTLGKKTMHPDQLRDLVEGKFVDALRAVAAEMAMEELHEQRVEFVQKVQTAVSEDLFKNGLELESVSLTGLDQTNRDFFNPDNAFDAAGLTKLTDEIEARRKRRNEIEQDAQVAIQLKNMEAEKQKLSIARDEEYARLEQDREIQVRRADQMAQVASEQAEKKRAAEEAEIVADRQVELAKIATERSLKEGRIEMERTVKERDIEAQKLIEAAEIERKKTVELTDQDRNIAIAEKSRALSESEAEAAKARAFAVREEEAVTTVRETEIAERKKSIELVQARQNAEREAIQLQVTAESKKLAAQDDAEAIRTLAEANAAEQRLAAQGEAEAEKLRVEAAELRYAVEAAGRRALNEAENLLSEGIVQMKVKLAVIEHLRDIVHESVKPLENIDGIKIIQVDGLTGGAGANGVTGNGTGANGDGSGRGLADQVVASALQYRSQAPLIDALMKEIGMSGGDLEGLARSLKGNAVPADSPDKPDA